MERSTFSEDNSVPCVRAVKAYAAGKNGITFLFADDSPRTSSFAPTIPSLDSAAGEFARCLVIGQVQALRSCPMSFKEAVTCY